MNLFQKLNNHLKEFYYRKKIKENNISHFLKHNSNLQKTQVLIEFNAFHNFQNNFH